MRTALRWKIAAAQRQRIQMVLLQSRRLGFAAFGHLFPRIRWRKRITDKETIRSFRQ
jgi:hypothetical protein